MCKPQVSDLLDSNRVMKDLQASSKRGLTFKLGLDWYSTIMCVISDSSFGNESEWIDEGQNSKLADRKVARYWP